MNKQQYKEEIADIISKMDDFKNIENVYYFASRLLFLESKEASADE